MPRPAKGARLYLKSTPTGNLWIIRDGPTERGTGCGARDRQGAEKALEKYLAQKHRPDFGVGDPDQVKIADILIAYCRQTTDRAAAQALPRLQEFWAGKTLAAITPKSCKAYTAWRCSQSIGNAKDPAKARLVKPASPRRELEVLRAAINHAHSERLIRFPVPVAVGDKPPARDRYLTPEEVDRLLAAAAGHPWGKHVERFILVGLYTGSRHSAILKLQWMPNTEGGWVDLERGLIFRKGMSERESKKRRPPVAIAKDLAMHLEQWRAEGGRYVIEYQGRPIKDLGNGFALAVKRAGLEGVTPHTLRHTFATWAVQAKASFSDVAEAIGTTEAIVRQVYGHMHPDYTRTTVELVAGRKKVR